MSESSMAPSLAAVEPQSTIATTKLEEALPATEAGANAWVDDRTCPTTTQDPFLSHRSDITSDSWEIFTGPSTFYGDDVNSSFDLGVINWMDSGNTNDWATLTSSREITHSLAGIDKPKPSTLKAFPELTMEQSSSTSEGFVIYSYYPFLEMENLPALRPEVTRFLEMSHSFHVPAPAVLDEFVRKYFLYVHPNVPMLDEGDFWEAYGQRNQRQNHRVPLLVFQAMIFAASSVSRATIPRLEHFQRLSLTCVTLVCLQ